MIKFYYLPVIFLCISCGPQEFRIICVDDFDRERACTAKELATIDGVHSITAQVRAFDKNTIAQSFTMSGTSGQPRVIFFGEEHTEIIGQIETLGAINSLVSSGDTILLEGADKSLVVQENCGMLMIKNLYINWQWEKLGQAYDLKEKIKWQLGQNFGQLFRSTRKSYDISDLPISKIYCGFWDDYSVVESTINGGVAFDNMFKRNESMAQAIDSSLSRSNLVLVNAGYYHLPEIDYQVAVSKNKGNSRIPKDRSKYYELAKTKPKDIALLDISGTTEPIFKYLDKNRIPYKELIHRKMLLK